MNKFLVVCILPALALAAPSRNGFRLDFGAGLPGAGEISGKISGNSDGGSYSTKANGNRALNGYDDNASIDIEGSYGRDGTPHVPLNTPFNVPTQFNADQAADVTRNVVKNVLAAIPNNELLNEEQLASVADYITTALRSAMVADPNQFSPDRLADTAVGIVDQVVAALPGLAPQGIPGVIGEIPQLINEEQVRSAVEKTIKSLGPALEYARDPLNANRPVDVEFKFGDAENFVELKPATPVAPVLPVVAPAALAPAASVPFPYEPVTSSQAFGLAPVAPAPVVTQADVAPAGYGYIANGARVYNAAPRLAYSNVAYPGYTYPVRSAYATVGTPGLTYNGLPVVY